VASLLPVRERTIVKTARPKEVGGGCGKDYLPVGGENPLNFTAHRKGDVMLVYWVPKKLVQEWPWDVKPRRSRVYFRAVLETEADFKKWEKFEEVLPLVEGEVECEPIFLDGFWEALFSLPK